MSPQNPSLHAINGGTIMKTDRRASKPLMEKRRRERINKSLNELKSILLNALRKDQSTCHSKLEKADILEMTVRYLRGIQRQRMSPAMPLDPHIVNKFRTGYMECKTEVSHFLDNSAESVQPEIKARLMSHLGSAVASGHVGPQMMGQAPRLLTTAPPVPVNAISPLQIQMAPNTQMQHAIAAAAAFGQGRQVMQHGNGGIFKRDQDCEPRLPCQEIRCSPDLSRQNAEHFKQARRISESSFASSGFASSSSPVVVSPSASPKKHHILKVKPQENMTFHQPMTDNEMVGTSQNSAVHSQMSHIPSISPSSSFRQSTPPPARSCSPSSHVSENDSESVWRPW